MRILHLLYHDSVGGQERSVLRLCRGLRELGIEVSIAFCHAENKLINIAGDMGIPHINFDMKFGLDFSAIPRMQDYMANFDVHHFHVLNLPLLIASRGLPQARRVFTERGGRLDGESLKKQVYYWVYRRFLNADFVACTANCRQGQRRLEKVYGLHQPSYLTYNGIDFENIHPCNEREKVRAAWGIGPTDFVLGTAGRLAAIKRIDRLIHLVARLSDPGIKCIIVGEGPLRSSLENLAVTLGVKARVIFTGLRANPYDEMMAMDLFAMPTIEGGFENAVVEAMALGVPAVVYQDGGGATEHIEHGLDGFIVKGEEELLALVHEFRNQRSRLVEIGHRAKNKVTLRYTMRNYLEGYLDVYRRIGLRPAELPIRP